MLIIILQIGIRLICSFNLGLVTLIQMGMGEIQDGCNHDQGILLDDTDAYPVHNGVQPHSILGGNLPLMVAVIQSSLIKK